VDNKSYLPDDTITLNDALHDELLLNLTEALELIEAVRILRNRRKNLTTRIEILNLIKQIRDQRSD